MEHFTPFKPFNPPGSRPGPFKGLRRFKVQCSKGSRTESEGNFHVSGILETSKRSKTGKLAANV
jgi:hypothetical protein